MSQTPSNTIPVNSPEKEVTMEHSVPMESDLPTSQAIPLLNVELALTSTTTREPSLETWLPKDHSVRTELELAPGPSRKRSRSPSSPSYPDATTFSDGEPAASESPELNPEDLTARLEDIEVEIDTLHADREDKEVLISELQDSLAASENEIAVLQLRVDDAEARQAEDHAQIQSILARLGLNLQAGGAHEDKEEDMVKDKDKSIVKDKSKDFETPTQGKTSGEADISPEGLEAAETLAKVLTRRTKTYTRKVKTRLRRKLDADEVNTGEGINTGFIDVNTAFEEINSGNESIIPSPKKEIVRLQAQEEAENARKVALERQDALIAKRVHDELELSETQKNKMAQVQEAAKYYTKEDWDSIRTKLEANRDLSSKVLSIDFSSDDFAKKTVELINEKKKLYKEQRERERDRRNIPMTQAE
ncbi:hypothetical protein Tco_0103452 [Tanacetum coccineum]